LKFVAVDSTESTNGDAKSRRVAWRNLAGNHAAYKSESLPVPAILRSARVVCDVFGGVSSGKLNFINFHRSSDKFLMGY